MILDMPEQLKPRNPKIHSRPFLETPFGSLPSLGEGAGGIVFFHGGPIRGFYSIKMISDFLIFQT